MPTSQEIDRAFRVWLLLRSLRLIPSRVRYRITQAEILAAYSRHKNR